MQQLAKLMFLIKLVLLSVLLCLLPAGAVAQKSARKTVKPQPPVVCNVAAVPKGMVVVGQKRNSACSGGTELLVKRPENGDIICAESPLPPQFSIATEAQGASTGTCPNKAFLIMGSSAATEQRSSAATESRSDSVAEGRSARSDDAIGRAFASRASDIQVKGEGTVTRLLPDDVDKPRHQRFIVELASGQTLLIAHNIDIAPRIDGLEPGDSVRFNGEYVWNAKGGVIHWTHHDPQRRHVTGWVIHNGKTYN